MITKEEFLLEFGGHANWYSSFMVIDVTLDDLIRVLNEIDPDMCVGSGTVSDTGRSISFEICKEDTSLIYDITRKLHCRGYSDIGGWFGEGYMEAAIDGDMSDDFKAEWTNDEPEKEGTAWDAFVTVTDNESGEIFYTGEGAVDYDIMLHWKEIVDNH